MSLNVDVWLNKYGPNYLSHATNNHAILFREKRLFCAEEILRKKGCCECEINMYANRGTVEKTIKPEKTNLIL